MSRFITELSYASGQEGAGIKISVKFSPLSSLEGWVNFPSPWIQATFDPQNVQEVTLQLPNPVLALERAATSSLAPWDIPLWNPPATESIPWDREWIVRAGFPTVRQR